MPNARWMLLVALVATVGCKRDKDDDGSKNKVDCEKRDGDVYPGADELCNGVDDDCDGSVDEEASDAPVWYADLDGDGFAGDIIVQASCEMPEGWYDAPTDCDEIDARAFPGAEERCNESDDDCDGEIDEEAVDATLWYPDLDVDGWGDEAAQPIGACARPDGDVVAAPGDCDDAAAWTHPFADEICDDRDNDCDGDLDEDAINRITLYADGDFDGHGDPDGPVTACVFSSDFVASSDDCDDDDGAIHPGAEEVCNDADDDCDGSIDMGAADAPTWHADLDGDGFGGTRLSAVACDAPAGYVADESDCDDLAADTWPGAPETCGNGDEDCGGDGDDGASDAVALYLDADLDGFGSTTVASMGCGGSPGLTLNADDCDDALADSFPGAEELCDGADNDCDGDVDNDVLGDGATCAGESCLTILDARYRPPSGLYWVDPEGDGAAIEVECDMATAGGGWTVIDGALLQGESWLAFSRAGGTASYTAGWYDRDGFRVLPNDGGDSCSGVAVRATAVLPFTFTEWWGEWSAMGGSGASAGDDDAALAWGATSSDCTGRVRFGTDGVDEKVGGEWGTDWTSATPYEVWRWAPTTVPSTSTIRWELSDDGPDEDVLITDIAIYVR